MGWLSLTIHTRSIHTVGSLLKGIGPTCRRPCSGNNNLDGQPGAALKACLTYQAFVLRERAGIQFTSLEPSIAWPTPCSWLWLLTRKKKQIYQPPWRPLKGLKSLTRAFILVSSKQQKGITQPGGRLQALPSLSEPLRLSNTSIHQDWRPLLRGR